MIGRGLIELAGETMVVGRGVDPRTFRFSGGRSAN
jgi:hypothetical protein